jgi:hypothetical protein
MGQKIEKAAGKVFNAFYVGLDKLGAFSPERRARQEAKEEKMRKMAEEHPGKYLATRLGKSALKAVATPIAGEILGDIAGKVIDKIKHK